MPIKDLIVIASHRLYLEDMKDSYKQESIQRGKEAVALRQALEASGKEIDLLNEGLDRARGELATMDEMLEECHKKQDGLRTWATVGKVGTITFSLAIVGIVTERIINSAKP